ncbi:MAG TPA: Cu(I)-responsive transcriptional regulator [Gammaproteobacteria bacterium]|nr:Cu(I)-responsive transcriptional regulator [Gammaproteobacteria bacterium]
MRIQEASRQSGMRPKTIRFYEEIGLVRPAARSANGYRQFNDTDVRTLKFIARARKLGFSVEDIQKLLSLWQDKKRASADVKKLALAHADEIEARIRELESVKQAVLDLADHCHGDDRPECPIIDELADGNAG